MLYAVWQIRCPDIPEPIGHQLLSDLAVPPTFYVPAHNISHSRHCYTVGATASGVKA
jgi:CRISPR-associated protein Csb2